MALRVRRPLRTSNCTGGTGTTGAPSVALRVRCPLRSSLIPGEDFGGPPGIPCTTPKGGGGIVGRERQIQLPKIAGKSQCRNQTSQSLNKQHLCACARDTQGHQKARKQDTQKAIAEKLREFAENCEKLRNRASTAIAPATATSFVIVDFLPK